MLKKILITCLVLTMVFTLAACGGASKKMDLNEYYTIEFSGTNGAGKATINGYSEFEEDLLQLLGENANLMTVSIIEDAIDLELDKKEGLSNGDKVTLTFKIDEDIEEGYDIKISGKPITVTVESLPEKQYEQVNPFDKLEINVTEHAPYLNIKLDDFTGALGIDGKIEIEYPREDKNLLYNGDKLIFTFTYDAELAEQRAIKITETKMEYTIEGIDTYIQSLEDVSQDQLDRLLKEVNNKAESETAYDNYWTEEGNLYRSPTYAKVEADMNLKYLGSYFLARKSTTKEHVWYSNWDYNFAYFVYSFTVINDKTKEPETIYMTIKVPNLLVTTDGYLVFDGSIVDFFHHYETSDRVYNQIVVKNKADWNIVENVKYE